MLRIQPSLVIRPLLLVRPRLLRHKPRTTGPTEATRSTGPRAIMAVFLLPDDDNDNDRDDNEEANRDSHDGADTQAAFPLTASLRTAATSGQAAGTNR